MKKHNQYQELAPIVLEIVMQIPYGKVATYGQIARLAGLPKHARFVGFVLKNIEDGAGIPWHRVINGQGQLRVGKLNEQGESIQRVKLITEHVMILNGKVNLKEYQWAI